MKKTVKKQRNSIKTCYDVTTNLVPICIDTAEAIQRGQKWLNVFKEGLQIDVFLFKNLEGKGKQRELAIPALYVLCLQGFP